jgi:uncharacterized repeat protein (TIGR01451 family)
MMRAFLGWGLVFLAGLAAAPAARAQGPALLSVSRDNQLRTIDPVTGRTLSSLPLTLGGLQVDGGAGLARHPVSGELFVLLRVAGQPGTELARLDPASGEAARIGNTGQLLHGLTFDADGKLYAVTAEAASLFLLNPRTGAARPIETPGAGLARLPEGATALTHWRGDFSLQADADASLFLVTASGAARLLSTLDHVATGLAFSGPIVQQCSLAPLYAAAHQGLDGPSVLFQINPTNGAATMVGPIGFERVSAMDFGPGGTLFATGERMDGSDINVLLTIDPCTGAGTEVGPTNVVGTGFGDVLADISFRRADGVLFAYIEGGDALGTLSTTTGAITFIGATNTAGCCGNGIAFSSNDTLFHANNLDLSTLNQLTAQETIVAPLAFPPEGDVSPRINAMDFRGDTLFGVLNDGSAGAPENYLTTINTTSGAVTLVGPTQGGLDALAFTSGVADLFLSKADNPDPALITINLTYTLTVANAGPETATGVMLTDTLPMGTTFSSSTTPQGSCTHSMGVVTCDLGTINAQASVTVTIVVTAPEDPGPITNMASVSLNEPDPNPANNSVSAATDIVDFELSVMPESVTVMRGNSAVYTVTLTPIGGRVDLSITLDCEMAPTGSSCIFIPSAPIPGGGPVNATLSLTTTNPSSAAHPAPALSPFHAAWLLAPLGLLVLGAGRRKRALVVLLLLFVVLALQVGCGGGDEAPSGGGSTGTPLGTHMFTVRGVVGPVQRSATVEVVVQ